MLILTIVSASLFAFLDGSSPGAPFNFEMSISSYILEPK